MSTRDFITLAQLARSLPRRDGKRVAPSTVYRWSTRGVRGVVLETWQHGNVLVTTQETFDRFWEQVQRTRKAPPSHSEHGADVDQRLRKVRIEKARRTLDRGSGGRATRSDPSARAGAPSGAES